MENVNDAVRQLVEDYAKPAPPPVAAPPTPARNEACHCGSGKKFKKCHLLQTEPEVFTFNTAKDNIGIPMEHREFVKFKCKLCGEKGYQRFYVKGKKELRACACVHAEYTRIRLKVEKEALAAIAKDIEEAESVEEPSEELKKTLQDRLMKARNDAAAVVLKRDFAYLL